MCDLMTFSLYTREEGGLFLVAHSIDRRSSSEYYPPTLLSIVNFTEVRLETAYMVARKANPLEVGKNNENLEKVCGNCQRPTHVVCTRRQASFLH